MPKCAICQKEFALDKSLHGHIKAHGLKVGEYYQKCSPRKDLYTNQLIEFKNKPQYFSAFFNSSSNMNKWFANSSREDSQQLIADMFQGKQDQKEFAVLPPDLYLRLAKLPDKSIIKRFFGSCDAFATFCGLDNFLSQRIPEGFWGDLKEDVDILIDTREQKPLSFPNSTKHKLDFGDYSSRGYYSKTFIERKSPSDFASTMIHGYDRFCRELERCKQFNSYMFVLIESTPQKMYTEPMYQKPNMAYLWHNVRELILEFPFTFQFCFTGNRAGSKFLIPRILYYGQQMWKVDLDFYLNRRMKHGVD